MLSWKSNSTNNHNYSDTLFRGATVSSSAISFPPFVQPRLPPIMRVNQHLGTAALLVANCGTRCFYAHAQPIDSLAHTGDNLNVDPKVIKAGESKSYEHIYSWEPSKRQSKKREGGDDAAGEHIGDALVQVSESHPARDYKERDDSGHTHRLLFDSRDGDSGVRWAYGERQGRWKEIRANENAVREHPFYG